MSYRKFLKALLLLICFWFVSTSVALAQQVALPGNKIPQFVDPLPALEVLPDTGPITLNMTEFQAPVMPTGFVPAAGAYTGTWVWGYLQPGAASRASYIGPVVVATRNMPTEVTYVNNLGLGSGSNLLFWVPATDQTLHWADPLNLGPAANNACNMAVVMGAAPTGNCGLNYSDVIPAVPHLHGGEVPAVLDGGPDAWFTNTAGISGHAYYTRGGVQGALSTTNSAVYNYPNKQEGANIWFHDHGLGVTRLNVYAGLAGAYLIKDPANDPPNLPPLIPLVIQDRMFDTNGQLFFPSIGINVEHPFWIPEFVGDTIVVNGKVWPYLAVDRQRYSFLILNGSNARAYDLSLMDPVSGIKGPRFWVTGTDGGYLDKPVLIDPNSTNKAVQKSLVIMPGERYEVIIDFNDPVWQALLAGQNLAGKPINLVMRNTAKTPFPGGTPAKQNTTGRIIQFRVSATAPGDSSFDPAAAGAILRGVGASGPAIIRLVDPVAGTLKPGVIANQTRRLTLNEVMGAGGPLEVLVNNTKLSGLSEGYGGAAGLTVRPDFTAVTSLAGITSYYSELPAEGTTEVWEIVNLTADAHPIHTHLTQFQLINRQNFNLNGYNLTYNAAFPGGLYMPAYGPPMDYNATNPIGGNPDVTPSLVGLPVPPMPYEAGWKDTVIMYPGQVTRIAIRYAPTDKAIDAADLYFPFNPDGGHGYVWHCHIIDHEDNEMMRPLQVEPKTGVTRTYVQGTDY